MSKKKKKNNEIDVTYLGFNVIDNGACYKILGLDFDEDTKKHYYCCVLIEDFYSFGYFKQKEFHRIAANSKVLETASFYSYRNGLIAAYDPSGKIKSNDYINFTGSANKVNIGEYFLGSIPEIKKHKKGMRHQGIVIERDAKTKNVLFILIKYD